MSKLILALFDGELSETVAVHFDAGPSALQNNRGAIMGDTLRGVVEFFETSVRESVVARTETLSLKFYFCCLIPIESMRYLGPPDLCAIVKVEKGKTSGKEVGGGRLWM